MEAGERLYAYAAQSLADIRAATEAAGRLTSYWRG